MKSGTELIPPDEIATAAAAAAGSGALAHLYPRLLLLQLLLLLLLPQAQGLSLTCIRIACCDRVHAAQRPPASADTSLCGKAVVTSVAGSQGSRCGKHEGSV